MSIYLGTWHRDNTVLHTAGELFLGLSCRRHGKMFPFVYLEMGMGRTGRHDLLAVRKGTGNDFLAVRDGTGHYTSERVGNRSRNRLGTWCVIRRTSYIYLVVGMGCTMYARFLGGTRWETIGERWEHSREHSRETQSGIVENTYEAWRGTYIRIEG